MAYTPTNWKDRDVENPRTYTARQNEDGSVTFFDAPGTINEAGTPVNAVNMNKIEEQLYKNDLERKTTNCITEIPQDIKLELNNGTLTLKAGSKVYVPNGKNADGSDKFDEVVISTDKTLGAVGTYTGYSLLYVHSNGSALNQAIVSESISGTTQPSGNGAWYDTGTNLIKIYSGGSDTGTRVSFPIAILHRTSGSWDAIGQVFNGFGYIGNTVFALPGVKGLIPNGRNEDGSLKNIEFTVQDVITETKSNETSTATLQISLDNSIQTPAGDSYREYPTLKSITKYDCDYYVEETNQMYFNQSKNYRFCVGIITRNSGTVTSLTPKTPFHAVDRNDSSWVSAQAMPSKKNIILTIGANESTYTAPANGYFVFRRDTIQGFVGLENVGKLIYLLQNNTSTSSASAVVCPVAKSDICKILYSGTASGVSSFIFVYAEGEN